MNSPAPLLRSVVSAVAACLDAFAERVATFIEIVMEQLATRRETGMQRGSRGAARLAVGFVRLRAEPVVDMDRLESVGLPDVDDCSPEPVVCLSDPDDSLIRK